MVVRETSARKIAAVLRHPDMQPYMDLDGVPPLGRDAYYLRLGRGLAVYLVSGDVADLHSYFFKGDVTKNFLSAAKEQFAYMKDRGVRTISTMHKSSHRRASFAASLVGMTKDQSKAKEGFNYYEIQLWA